MKQLFLRFIAPIIGLALFLAALGFAVKNSQLVTLHYYLGVMWQAPLVAVLFVAFAIGAAVGVAASFSFLYRQRREILTLKRESRNRTASKGEA